MLEILNRYAHGLASIPFLHALRERGCLEYLVNTGPVSAEQLAQEFSANRAYLDVALRMLTCLDCIRPTADGRYEARPGLADLCIIPDQIMDLYRFPFDLYVQGEATDSLDPWLERSEERWNSKHSYFPDYLDGLLIIPLLLSLRAQGRLCVTEEKAAETVIRTLNLTVNPACRRVVEQLFVAKEWATRSGDVLYLSQAGRFVIDRIFVTATVASYRPMFVRAQELLFGDATRVFSRDADGHETHVDRTINVVGSGFQHEKYFVALSDVVAGCFDGDAYESQPKYIVDMGCGDGTLLRRLYEMVRDRTRRGKVLDVHPLIPIGVDFNEKALLETSRTLAGIEHITAKGDIGDPRAMLETLRAHGVTDLDRVLHVRSFLDHDRPYRRPEDRKAAERRSPVSSGIYIDGTCHAIAPSDMIQSTVEHLRRWSQILNPHGLVMLEVHCLPPDVTAQHLDESENFHFDAYHAMSHQFLLTAQTFLACAAEAGMFCREGHSFGFPKNLPFTRISLNHFQRRPYIVRRAHHEDLPALAQLNQVWTQGQSRLGADKAVRTLENATRELSESEFVLEIEGRLMASVRCDQKKGIRITSARVRPGAPATPLRDLLQFVEQYWALAGVDRVIGMDDCRSKLSALVEESSVPCAVAHEMRIRVAEYPFAAKDDPRAAERELGAFSFRWLLAILQRMGVMHNAGEVYELDALERRLGVVQRYHRYFEALMSRLQDEGLVTMSGRRVETTPLVSSHALTSVEEQVAEFKQSFQERYPANVALMNLTACCLCRFDEIITGRVDITDVVFQNADVNVFTEIFRGGVVPDYFNRIVSSAVQETVVRLKATTPKTRILEIGAGTGATTAAILNMLQPFSGCVEFCFSDISQAFIRNAKRRFEERYPWVEYRLLNIEEDISRQGFELHSFDLIVAANVLHDTRDIEVSLQQVRRLLKPGGLLVLDEYTSVKDCLFFSGALLRGYWLFQDPERRLKNSCLLGVQQWARALENAGFSVVGSHILPTQSLDAACSQSVMLCEALATSETAELPECAQPAQATDANASSRKIEIVETLVEQQILDLLGKERASAYARQRPLMDMGLDSIELVELKSLIERRLGVKLSPTFLFAHETPEKFTAALVEMVSNHEFHESEKQGRKQTAGGRRSNSSVSGSTKGKSNGVSKGAAASGTRTNQSVGGRDRIAVIGMAGQFPQARNLEEYWKNLAEGKNCIKEVSRHRWDVNAYYQAGGAVAGKSNSRWAGEIEGYDRFDPLFFNISPTEAESMDPQQRLFLQASWHAVEDAGYDGRGMSGSKCGVFVGCESGDYHQLSRRHQLSAQGFTGGAISILAARIAYFMNLQGPCVSIDTACSSSLVALANACDSLSSGSSDVALAGGVYVMTGPELHIRTTQAGMLSPEGRCYTFDQRANGFVPGECVGVVVLKRLGDAERDGDLIYGVIEGWGVNQDGKTNGITAPNPESQTRLEQEVYERYGIDAGSIQLIEAHGTGTKLGDPVEVEGLKNAFRKYTEKKEYCALGSVKSNIGHCLAAAGVAGAIKVLLALKHRQLPPTINFEQLNEHIELKESPFYVNDRLREWELKGGVKRQAAVSSFGFSGTNAHVVVGEYEGGKEAAAPAEVVKRPGTVIVPLSARTEEQLKQKAEDLLAWIEREPGVDLEALAYTLQVGRTAMEERVGLLVSSVEQLREKLKAYIGGEGAGEDIYKGDTKGSKETLALFADQDGQQAVEKWMANKKLAKLLGLWVKGLELDWKKLYAEKAPRRLRVPLYPFAQERYWIDEGEKGLAGDGVVRTGMLHPLLHSNTSDMSEQRYSSTFSGEEFFLADHRVRMENGTLEKVLPGVAILEMARVAIELAWPRPLGSTALELRNTVWLHPITGTERRQINLRLLANQPEQIEYEIYSGDGEGRTVHCQGAAQWTEEPAALRLDLDQLKRQMVDGDVEPAKIYAAFTSMGILHGAPFQGISALHQGKNQLLTELHLRGQDTRTAYVMHPGLMDSVLQGHFGLVNSWKSSQETRLPFSLERMRILSPGTQHMFAWVRYAPGSHPKDAVLKSDIDVCDEFGNVCFELRGFSIRALNKGVRIASKDSQVESLLCRCEWQTSPVAEKLGQNELSQHHVIVCELSNLSLGTLESLLRGSQCSLFQAKTENHIGQRYTEYALECFERIQTILRSRPEGKVLVQVVVPAHEEQTVLAGLSGLLKTASLENPQFFGQVILVPRQITTEELGWRLHQEKDGQLEPLVRYQQEVRQVLSWTELAEAPPQPEVAFHDAGVYLITGGLGALGVVFAKEILSCTRNSRVVLTGRKALHEVDEDKQALLRSLGEDAERVSYRQLDLEDLDEVQKVMAAIKQEYGQLNGILHSAGMIADNFIVKKTESEFKRVLGPKVTGTYNLDAATKEMDLDFFVLFSSVASVMGNVGQADYASANGFMDQFAAYRNRLVVDGQRHGRTRSINWPLWQDGGMRLDAANQELFQKTTGLQPMETSSGLRAFHHSFGLPHDEILILEGNVPQLRRVFLLPSVDQASSPVVQRAVPFPTDANGADADRHALLEKAQDYLCRQCSEALKMPAHRIDPQAPLENYGVDSILAVNLTNHLEQAFGPLSKTLFFEYQTIHELAKYFTRSHSAQLATLLSASTNGKSHSAAQSFEIRQESRSSNLAKLDLRKRFSQFTGSSQRREREPDGIAIIGLSGRYAGATSLRAYWQNLREGKDCIVEVPKERWDWRQYFSEDRSKSGHHYCKWGGFIAVDEFDPLFFNISPKEAKYIDPQERLFLQHAWMAVEDAGYTRAGLQVGSEKDLPGQVGVYVGVWSNEYQLRGDQGAVREERKGFAVSIASIANRVSYVMNVHGPSMTVDTMCSSSLTAIHLACEELKRGRIQMAIAGGVNVNVHPSKYLMLSELQAISSEGRCQSFGEGGDGYVPGEGVGVVVLKRLAEAERDGDHIYGVIRGSALNHGGKTNGYTVPNPQAQASLIRGALAEAKTEARHISYLEAHGTGTKLGDPIEIAALNQAFQGETEEKQYCAIGSVKSNIGHCESAAGIAGLTKVLLQMQHGQLVPSLHAERLNPYIEFEKSAFVVNRELRAWERPVVKGQEQPRIAGISSFGAGGSNAHVIVQEYVAGAWQRGSRRDEVVMVLSARTEEQLKEKGQELLEWMREEREQGREIDLETMAYTLQVGREGMTERLGMVVRSVAELEEKLTGYVGGKEKEGVYRGQAKRNNEDGMRLFSSDADLQEMVGRWMENGKYEKLLELWVRGMEVEWERMYGERKPRRMSLPTYPFAREHYWIDEGENGAAGAGMVRTGMLHPLLHSNTSDMSEQRYSSTFSGEEFFLADHRVRIDEGRVEKVLPGVAILEMARAAIELAWPRPLGSTALELHNTVWLHPIIGAERKQINLRLLANQPEQIEYEIYSGDGEGRTIHCQGAAQWTEEPAALRLDLDQLKRQMVDGDVEPAKIYAAFASMGVFHGTPFQRISALHQGKDQLLTEMHLRGQDTRAAYVMHPSLLDSAIQGHYGLMNSWRSFQELRLPFSLERMRILSPGTQHMFAWVRCAPGSHPEDAVLKSDIDVCDEFGNVCFELRGFSIRALNKGVRIAAKDSQVGSLLCRCEWQTSPVAEKIGQNELSQHHVIVCELSNLSLGTLQSLLPGSQCSLLQVETENHIGQRYTEYALECFERIQTILRSRPEGKVFMQVVVPDHEEQTVLAGLSGLLKTASLENPQLFGQVILVPREITTEELGWRLHQEKDGQLEPLVRYQQEVRQVLSWTELAEAPPQPEVAFHDAGVYLITGGLGALGVVFAKEILSRTRNSRVILTGRKALHEVKEDKQALLRSLGEDAERVSYRQLDLEDLNEVQKVMAAIKQEYGQLNGILHSAGMIADNFIVKKTGSEFKRVLGPKVTGTWNLDAATKEMELEFFVLFSSVASVMGNVGQADYASANGFMDQFAAYRNRLVAAGHRHGRTRSINWPLWQDGGMATDPGTRQLLQQITGMQAIKTETGLEAFYDCLSQRSDQILAVEGNLAQIRPALMQGEPAPLPSEFEAVKPAIAAAGTDAASVEQRTQDYLRRQFSELLHLEPHKIDPTAPLEIYGIDSIQAMKLTNQLEQTFGSLSKTLFFEYQTIAGLTGYFMRQYSEKLATLFAGSANRSRVPNMLVSPPSKSAQADLVPSHRFARSRNTAAKSEAEVDGIAIIGLSGRYPEAAGIRAYWQNLREGKDCIVEVPRERWDWREYYSEDRSKSGHHYCKWGGFIAVDEFDPLFFNISPKEAKYIDPQERLFLQHAWMAVEDAGYTRAGLQVGSEKDLAGQVGVYVGVWSNEYQLRGDQGAVREERKGFAVSIASIANRVSYVLNVHGPSMTVDTMCSSSLTAIHLACQELRQGRIGMAIAGGVNVNVHPNKYLMLSAAQGISSEGRCQSFGEGGDGYVPGEGVGVIVLKRLAEAERDGDHIYGVIRGSALNHGGKTNGYTVPNPQAQASLIRGALADAKTEAREISYLEAHGTGTKLGDPIEIAALNQAFETETEEKQYCAIGSVKSNIGHCESAAGIAGLTKVLLQMQHGQLVPSLHAERLNPYIEFEKSAFLVNRELRAWERPVVKGREVARIAGISSFGAGGSNAHVIVEEYVAREEDRASTREEVVITLSARTEEQLKEKARELLEYIGGERAEGREIDLEAMAYTLQVGREGMTERLGMVVRSVAELEEKLTGYVGGKEEVEGVYRGQGKRNEDGMWLFSSDADLQETVRKWIENGKYEKLLELWVRGVEVEWGQMYGERKPRRMSLPTYPFAREHYWIEAEVGSGKWGVERESVLHPLVHRNTSDLSEQRYSTTLTGEEFFLTDHEVAGKDGGKQKVLPAAAYLEMARAAIEHAWPERPGEAVLELHDTVWSQPVIVNGKKQIHLALWVNDSGRISYQIYSKDGELEIVYCQGQAEWGVNRAETKVDLTQLKRVMECGNIERTIVYETCARRGLHYGPAFQGIITVHRGQNEVLAELRMPSTVEETAKQYVLHPSMLDSALHACFGLIDDELKVTKQTLLPFALKTLHVVAPCTNEMFAWVRYATEKHAAGRDAMFDIDLCDALGNICVKMNGFAARAVAGDLGESRTGKEEDKGERILRSNEPSLEGPKSDNLPRINSASKSGTTSDLLERVTDSLANTVCGLLEVKKEDIDVGVSLSEFGFDSITFTNFARSINHDFGLELTPAIFFEPWTLRSLAIHLVDTYRERLEDKFGAHTGAESGVPPQEHKERPQAEITRPERWKRGRGRLSSRTISGPISEATGRRGEEPIAVIGMSGRFPGARDLEEFWANLEAGKESISEIPPDRWKYPDKDGDEYKRAAKWGAFIDGIDEFDPLFFGISPREAEMIDPQQRLLMMYGWKAIEDAGYAPGQLWGSRTGVFVGTGNTGYNELLERPGIRIEGYSAPGVVPSIGPCRLSYILNLHGPSEPIETACSSSLVAVHRAVRAIRDGDCETALAGGVNTLLSPRLHMSFSKAGMLSMDGRCKTFSNRADGYVRGEGVGMLLLKRLEAAERDGDHIYGLILGTAENHGGRANSLTAPNSQAQAELIKDAYRKAGISPRSVSYIEAHGTGTQLGDPTEINGLSSAFGSLSEEMGEQAAASYCGLGSVKSNIGHTELAAGIAGLIKVLLQLKHQRLAKSLNCDEVNPYIRLDGTPFYIVQETRAWQRLKDEAGSEWPLRAGVSSFGFGGVNAHVVIEEYTDAIAPEDAGKSVPAPGDRSSVFVLSAKTPEQLKEQAMQLSEAIVQRRFSDADVSNLAYTLQLGRDAMNQRLAIIARSMNELKAKLDAFVQGRSDIEELYRGEVKRSSEIVSIFGSDEELLDAVAKWMQRGKWSKLLELWVQGVELDWTKLYSEPKPHRMSLPTYPFARERYWFDGTAKGLTRVMNRAEAEDGKGAKRESGPGLECFVPVWNAAEPKRRRMATARKVLLLGGDAGHLEWVRRSYPEAYTWGLGDGASIAEMQARLKECEFDHLLWIAPDVNCGEEKRGRGSELIEEQERGVVAVYRMMKALLGLGYWEKELNWTLITSKTQRVKKDEEVRPAHAGVIGLVGSVAKEYPQWELSLLDVESLEGLKAEECLSVVGRGRAGEGLAHRQGEWYAQEYARIKSLKRESGAGVRYRQNGVYVVIGGAGGLGEVWTRYMMERYQARVVWIGRRKKDAALEAKIRGLAGGGGEGPWYISADATKLEELEEAGRRIEERYGAIHGVVQSAIVLRDQSLMGMEEENFRASLSAKVDVSVNMDRVFGKRELDFMLFFSSIIAFVKSAGQANYVAGSTFKDSYAQQLQQERGYAVKIMNWGYWGSVGVVAEESYSRAMKQMGVGSIEPEEGMGALEKLMESELEQMGVVKTIGGAERLVHFSEKREAKPVADSLEDVEKTATAARRELLLVKDWVASPSREHRSSPGKVMILATRDTSALAARLAARLPESQILPLSNHDSTRFELEIELQNYHGLIDLTGCGQEQEQSLLWLSLVQRWIERGPKGKMMGLCVTRGLEGFQNSAMNLSGVLPMALFRMLQSEYSNLRSRHMDADLATAEEDLVEQIASEFLAEGDDSHVCYRNGIRHMASFRITEGKAEAGETKNLTFQDDRVLWITGGTRGLGYLCARHFIRHYGVKRLLLSGREVLPERGLWNRYKDQDSSVGRRIRAIRELEAEGASVEVSCVPLTDQQALSEELQRINKTMGPIGGIIHCAGFADATNPAFVRKDRSEIQKLMAPKVAGLETLIQYCAPQPLQFLILFSSASAAIPSLAAGCADYAMANAYMDYVAESRARELPIISIQWPSWKESGMGEVKTERFLQTGLLSMSDIEGLRLLDRILACSPGPVVLPAVVADDKWSPDQLMQRAVAGKAAEKTRRDDGAKIALTHKDLLAETRRWLLSLMAEYLKIDRNHLDLNTPLTEYGVDSILLTQLLRTIGAALDQELDPSLLFEHTTIQAFANWLTSNHAGVLARVVGPADNPEPDAVRSVASVSASGPVSSYKSLRTPQSLDIAVVGLSCRFPGSADLKEYWQLLAHGRSAIRAVPASRWGAANDYYAGLLDDVTHFDPKFFLIPDADARAMDPQALLILEECLHLIYHAGYSAAELKGCPIGVYLGARSPSPLDDARLIGVENPIMAVGQNYLAANVSRFFDFRGPSLVVDTACSSALVAMNMAIQSLQSGEISGAIVGGVNVLHTDAPLRMFRRRGILNREPEFHLFDQRAGGAVLGEGAGVVLLKTLEQAIADRDTVYAVVKALAINNDGRTGSATAPNLQAQRDVMRMALERSGKSPQEISYIAVNGSGSEVTDLLELKAIESVYRQTDSWRCALGSMKPSIGHPLSAEGIASFIHVVLMLHKRQLVPFISAERPMKHYDFAASPFYFVRSLSPWGEERHTAAVNCFADGGTNAHVILDSPKSEDGGPTRQPLDPPVLHRIDLTEAPAPDRETQGIRGIQNGKHNGHNGQHNGKHNGAGNGHHKSNGTALLEYSPPTGLDFWD